MILIPHDQTDRKLAIDLFLDAMENQRPDAAEAVDLLGQLRLMGDVANLERVSRFISQRAAR